MVVVDLLAFVELDCENGRGIRVVMCRVCVGRDEKERFKDSRDS